jgi:hypothetical protein
MTIEHLIPVNRYMGDGAQTVFPVAFPLFGNGRHVRAAIFSGNGQSLEERRLEYGRDYLVRALPGGGECETAAPVPAGRMLSLSLDLPVAQPRVFENLGRLDAKEIEKGMDYLTALVARHEEVLSRSLRVSAGESQSPEELLSGIFAARDQSLACRDRACECADMARSRADAAAESRAGAEAARDEAKALAGHPRGFLGLLPFRSNELPFGWHHANGGKFALDSPQGQALHSLPAGYKEDWGIRLHGDGTINLPDLYHDGRGVFLRAGIPGKVVDDTMRPVTGSFGRGASSGIGDAVPTGAVYSAEQHPNTLQVVAGAYSWNFGLNSGLLGANYNGAETAPLHRGMLPAIFLGV